MDEDKFILSKTNKILIAVVLLLVLILIVVSVFLIRSLSNKSFDLPYLETTRGRTSTIVPRTSSTTTTTTTTTTAPRPLASPYYIVDMDTYLTEEAYTKQKVNRQEAETVVLGLYEFANKFFNISDNSLLDIATTLECAKEGESDVLTENGTRYGIIYNFDAISKKAFAPEYIYSLTSYTIDGKNIFIKKSSNEIETYYRIENTFDASNLVLVSVSIDDIWDSVIRGSVKYYLSNYKEQGYSAPVYKTVPIELYFSDNRWRLSKYKYPTFE